MTAKPLMLNSLIASLMSLLLIRCAKDITPQDIQAAQEDTGSARTDLVQLGPVPVQLGHTFVNDGRGLRNMRRTCVRVQPSGNQSLVRFNEARSAQDAASLKATVRALLGSGHSRAALPAPTINLYNLEQADRIADHAGNTEFALNNVDAISFRTEGKIFIQDVRATGADSCRSFYGSTRHEFVQEIYPGAWMIIVTKVEFETNLHRSEFVNAFGPHNPVSGLQSEQNTQAMVDRLKEKRAKLSLHVIQLGGNIEKTREVIAKSKCLGTNIARCRETREALIESFPTQLQMNTNSISGLQNGWAALGIGLRSMTTVPAP